MEYKVGEKLIYIKDNSKVHKSNRYFIQGHKYKITKVSSNFIFIETIRKNRWQFGNIISPFKIKILDNYFRKNILNKNIRIL
jgi:hypothetical protein